MAPTGLVKAKLNKEIEVKEAQADDDIAKKQQRQIFVKNLNFKTTELELENFFKNAKIGAVRSVKIVRRSDTQQSRGYGFVEVDSQEAAEKALKKLQNALLDEHALKLSLSTKAVTSAEEEQKKAKVLKKRKGDEQNETQIVDGDAATNKLLVKNLAFEATSDEIKELFAPFGHIRKVRLPLKANSNNHRGFGFVEFVTKEEAKNAFKQMQNSHLYSRKLVIEYAQQGASADDQTGEANKRKKV